MERWRWSLASLLLTFKSYPVCTTDVKGRGRGADVANDGVHSNNGNGGVDVLHC
jgi:hypothetical protein